LVLVLLLAGAVISLWFLKGTSDGSSGNNANSGTSAADKGGAGKSLAVTNPGFEEGLHGWVSGFARWDVKPNSNYEVVIDTATAYQGQASASIMPISADMYTKNGAISYKMAADELRGKRVRYSAYVKAEDVNNAGLWMEMHGTMEVPGVDGPMRTNEFFALRYVDLSMWNPIEGTVDWDRYEVVVDVPEEAEFILFGLIVWSKQGRVWLDDVQLEIVGDEVALTCRGNEQMTGNSDFEDGEHWGEHRGPKFYTYHAGTSRQAAYEGELGAYLRIDKPATDPDYYAVFADGIDVSCLRGRKVTVSAYTNADAADGRAILRADVQYAIENGDDLESSGRNYLKGDYLTEQVALLPSTEAKGDAKKGWQRQELTLDVPYTATDFTVEIRLVGKGEIWLDNVRVEAH